MRSKEIDKNSPSYIRGRYGVHSEEYKAAVARCKRTNPANKNPNQPLPGESPLEFARRRRKNLNQEK